MGKSFRTRGSVEKDRGGRDKVGIQVVAQELNLARPLGEITHGLCNHVPLFITFVTVGWIDRRSKIGCGCQFLEDGWMD